MGLVGPGFVGAHHVDAVRRLGNVDVVGVAASSASSARAAADRLGIPRAYGDYDALVADPDVHVVHVATPNYLHAPVVKAALRRRKHVVCDKPLALSCREAEELLIAARDAGVVHAVTFNYRGNPMVQEARTLVARGELGSAHFVHGSYLQDWLIEASDFSWRLELEKGGESSAIADIGSHWFDLVEHVVGTRIASVCADVATVVATRIRPDTNAQSFAGHVKPGGAAVDVQSEDLAAVLLRFENGARGVVSVGQVCAGHKNDLVFEVNGLRGSLAWRQERQNELWIGRRDDGNMTMMKDPALVDESVRHYARLPPGHQEGWADAFRNVMADIYGFIADGRGPNDPHPPAFATFEDGYRSNCAVEAILKSAAAGGAWTEVANA
jgi:predicted dehydrogenase